MFLSGDRGELRFILLGGSKYLSEGFKVFSERIEGGALLTKNEPQFFRRHRLQSFGPREWHGLADKFRNYVRLIVGKFIHVEIGREFWILIDQLNFVPNPLKPSECLARLCFRFHLSKMLGTPTDADNTFFASV